LATEGLDPSLLQDFLTESGELLEKLDADLVTLESISGSEQKDMLDGIFRALHTIKGAASFLGLTELIAFAHVAEDTLNRLRKGEVSVSAEVMDAMLRSVDVLRGMLDQIDTGQPITPAPEALFATLHAIVAKEGGPSESSNNDQETKTPSSQGETEPDRPEVSGGTKLSLPPEKMDLLEFMVIDLDQSIDQIGECIEEFRDSETRSGAAQKLGEVAEDIYKTGQFFGMVDLPSLAQMLQNVADNLAGIPVGTLDEVIVRIAAINSLIKKQSNVLVGGIELSWPLDTLLERLEMLIAGRPLSDDVIGQHENKPERVLEIDGVIQAADDELNQAPDKPDASQKPTVQEAAPVAAASANPTPDKVAKEDLPTAKTSVAEKTIRVEVGRLESLLNLVGRLVLNKNRVLALTRKVREHEMPHEVEEQFASAAGDLDQLTGELQAEVMRTRMQPLAKLFDRYPRVIRDIARMTSKKINLELIGKETEVDKSVIEVLSDPLVHILRNSADHGIETPEIRAAAGKPELGTIRLRAEHQGSHVRVEIEDDGKGLDREVIGAKAIERGLVNSDQLAALSDAEVFRFIFNAGFSTAEKVTDLSGRGVGMDVVRTNITKINGSINITAKKGHGTSIEILIPLTVAIMPAMMVGVGKHSYAVPLTSVIEIVKPEGDMIHSVGGQPVMRLRDTVLPLLDMRERLQEIKVDDDTKFAVVVGVGQQRAGLVVDRLIGQQEIVIKPLDDRYTSGGPFSGATIRDDGNVSLILDVIQLIRQAQNLERAAA